MLSKGTVSRRRLVERLKSAGDAPLLLVTAPAGYGKTTLLAEWAAQDKRPSGWLTLRRTHDDPAFLLGSIVEALSRIEPVDPAVAEALSGMIPDIEGTALPRLQAALQADRTAFTLVLDDLHRITEPACFEVLTGIIECLPAGSAFLLAGRAEPHLPLGGLRAGRRLGEVTQADLVMTRSEGRDLFAGLGLELTPESVITLLDRTEGWPAALYLAGLSFTEQPDVNQAIAEFAGDDRFVVDYLRDEFVSGRSEAELAFLTNCSILDRMSGPLCDAVLGETGSGEKLRDLSRSNVLLTRLDHRDEWFRYHSLLREMLASELHRLDPATEKKLHARASAWYAEREDFDHAISHAISSGEDEAAGRLIWAAVPYYGGHGRIVTIEHWLDRFEDSAIAARTPLALTAIFIAATRCDGDAVDRWIAAAHHAFGTPGGEVPRDLAPGLKLGEAVIARHGAEQMKIDALDSYELAADDDPWRSLACMCEGIALAVTGEEAAGRSQLEEAISRSAAIPHVQALSYAQLALLVLDEDRAGAGELLGFARAQMKRHGLRDYSTMAFVLAVSSLHDARSGRTERAAHDIDDALSALGDVKNFAPWFETQTRIVLAKALIRLGDLARARDLLADAKRHFERFSDATLVGAWIQQADRAIGDASTESGLTPAELRVLQYMPTHLSFREIATHLYVSPNTVKTQAQAIYRKLDVSARAEAVDFARTSGLLDAAPTDEG